MEATVFIPSNLTVVINIIIIIIIIVVIVVIKLLVGTAALVSALVLWGL